MSAVGAPGFLKVMGNPITLAYPHTWVPWSECHLHALDPTLLSTRTWTVS